MPVTVPDELIEKLKSSAREEAWIDDEDFNAYDFSGGNFDDAFFGGVRVGESNLARTILTSLGISWEQ